MRVSIQKAIVEELPVELTMRSHRLTGFDPNPEVILLAQSHEWALAHRVEAFDLNGFFVVSRGCIKSLNVSKHTSFRKGILQSEGLWKRIQRIPRIDLTSAATILSSLRKQKQLAIAVCETFDTWRSFHCRVDQIIANYVMLHGFDGAGKWESRPRRIPLDDITRIYFGSRYLKLYRKYLPESN